MLRLQPGMISLSRDSPGRQGGIRDLELGVVEGHAHEPRHAADAGTDALLRRCVFGGAVPEGCERGRPGL